MTQFPQPSEPEPTIYLKLKELVDHDPPFMFLVLRVAEGDTQFGPKWYVNIQGPSDGDYCISWKQGDPKRDAIIAPMSGKPVEDGTRFSLWRTGPNGATITIGPPKTDAVAFEQAELEQVAAAKAGGEGEDDIPF